MSRRTVLMIAFAGLLSLGLIATRGDAQPSTVKLIVPGVWFREGDILKEGHCNNVIVEMKDYLIVVDANFPSGARAVLNEAKKLSSKPVKYVFDTHHHGDHAYGNAVWTKAGAITLAYQGVADEMKRYEPKRWQETAKQRKDVGELNAATVEAPKQTFSKSPYTLEDGVRVVQFHFFGWAHTRGDGFVYLPKEKVLATGDAAVNGPFNYTADGNITNWPKVIAAAQALEARHVLPGHGAAGGKEILENQARFFIELRAAVNREVKAGKKLSDVVTLKNGTAQSTTIQLSADVKKYIGDGFAGQVRDAYNEITSGKAAGDLPH